MSDKGKSFLMNLTHAGKYLTQPVAIWKGLPQEEIEKLYRDFPTNAIERYAISNFVETVQDKFVVKVGEYSYVTTPDGKLYDVKSLVSLYLLLTYLYEYKKFSCEEENISISLKEWANYFGLLKEWKQKYAEILLRTLQKWKQANIVEFYAEEGGFYEGFVFFEIKALYSRDRRKYVTDIILQFKINTEFVKKFFQRGALYLLPSWLMSWQSELLLKVAIFYYGKVYPFGYTHIAYDMLKRYFSSGLTDYRLLLNRLFAWFNWEILHRSWQIPSTGEIREGNPPLLFYKQPNGAYLFYTANTYFLDNGLTKGGTQEDYIRVPEVFQLSAWESNIQKAYRYPFSPAFSLLQSLSEQHPDLTRFFLLLLDEYMNAYGKEQTNTFLSSIVKATPTKYKGHIALRKLFEEIPEHEKVYLFDRDFIKAFISYLQEAGFLDSPITHRFLHNIRDALKNFLPAYIERQEDMLLEDVITLSEEQKKAFELVWKSSPSLQEEYLKKLVGEEELKSLSETQKRVLLVRAKQIFLQEMAKGL